MLKPHEKQAIDRFVRQLLKRLGDEERIEFLACLQRRMLFIQKAHAKKRQKT